MAGDVRTRMAFLNAESKAGGRSGSRIVQWTDARQVCRRFQDARPPANRLGTAPSEARARRTCHPDYECPHGPDGTIETRGGEKTAASSLETAAGRSAGRADGAISLLDGKPLVRKPI